MSIVPGPNTLIGSLISLRGDLGASISSATADPDYCLVAKAASGDRWAFTDLTRRYQGRIYNQALRILRDPSEAEETTQDVLLTVYKKLDHFRGESKFSSWIYRVTENSALSRLRSHLRQSSGSVSLNSSEGRGALKAAVSRIPDPFRCLLASEGFDRFQEALRRLPSQWGKLFFLKVVEGLSYEELAAAFGIPDGTIKSRIHHVRRALLEDLGIK